MNTPLLSVKDLHKTFRTASGRVDAVRGVSFVLQEGSTLGIVGESGSGKSTTGFCVLRLEEPSSGTVHFDGHDVVAMNRRTLRHQRREMQIVFQDPFSSLDPRMSAGEIVAQPLRVHHVGDRRSQVRRVNDLLELVGIGSRASDKRPREFSGGQRQRVGIARALALNPRLIVCDEPVSSLDVSIQAQIINLLRDIQREFALSYLFISHDIAVVRAMSDHVCVMRKGEVVEAGTAQEVLTNPQQEYTKSLLDAVPVADPEVMKQRRLARSSASDIR